MKMYSVHDKISNAYANPFFAVNDGMALRLFEQNVNDESSALNKNPSDFHLAYIGEFEPTTGILQEPSNGPTRLVFASEMLNPSTRNDIPEIDEVKNRVNDLFGLIENLTSIVKAIRG